MKVNMKEMATLMKKITIIQLLAFFGLGCDEDYARYKLNPNYRYDILAIDTNFKFDPKNLPKLGDTAEDLDQKYPEGPTFRWSFKKIPLEKEFDGKKLKVDRVIDYEEIKKSHSRKESSSGMVNESFGWTEKIRLEVFIYDNKVVYFFINHLLNDAQGTMKPGKYQTGGKFFNGKYGVATWPGNDADIKTYWNQRGDKENLLRYAITPSYKKEVWRKAADPKPGERK